MANKSAHSVLRLSPEQLRAEAEARAADGPLPAAEERPLQELLHELQVHQIELAMQNEELRRALVALEESRDRYFDLYEFAPIGYLTIATDGTITEANLAATGLFGVERKVLLKKRFERFIAFADRERWHRFRLGMRKNEGKQTIELEFEPANGPLRHGRLDCLYLAGTDGAYRLRVTLTDITERKLAEDALRDSDARYYALLDQAPDGIFVSDSEGRYQVINQEGARMLGYSQEELLGMSIPDILLKEERFRVPNHLQCFRDLPSGVTVSSEWRFQRKDGSVFIGEVMGRRLSDGRLQGILRDITPRRQLEEKLWLQAEILDKVDDGVNLVSCADMRILFTNAAFESMFGYAPGELLGQPVAILNAATQNTPQETAQAIIESLRANGCWQGDLLNRRKDESTFWTNVKITAHDIPGWGQVWLAVQRDITARKEFEATLAQRDNLLRIISHNVEDHIWVLDRQHRIQFLNPPALVVGRAGELLSASDIDGLLGKTEFEIFGDSAEIQRLSQTNEEVMHKNVSTISEEYVPTTKGPRYMLAKRWPFYDSAGQVIGLVGIARDITERKQEETERLIAVERQRDTLVREVHHRIKNHLQGVTGLLRNIVSTNPTLAALLNPVITRILTIAEVYGLQSRVGEYQVRLKDLVQAAIAVSPATVEFNVLAKAAEFPLPQTEVVPLALVINELLTNAQKHLDAASPERPVRIDLDENEQSARLNIAGGPARLPQGFDFAKHLGLGMGLELVAALLSEKTMRLSYCQLGDDVVATLQIGRLAFDPPSVEIE